MMDFIKDHKRATAIGAGLLVVCLLLLSRCGQDPSQSTNASGNPANRPAFTTTTTTRPASTTTTGKAAVTTQAVSDIHEDLPGFAREPSNPAESWWLQVFPDKRQAPSQPDRIAAWSDPANSDADEPAAVTDLGKRVMTAYLTGEGRDQWPGYFSAEGTRSKPVQNVKILGAAAAVSPAVGDGWVRVGVLWSGDVTNAVTGAVEPKSMFTEILFTRDAGGAWTPRHCWEAERTTACRIHVLQLGDPP